MRILAILFLILLFGSAKSQSFYDINTVQNISIDFGYTNWDYRLDTAKAGSEDFIVAKSCTINGVVFDSVGVKYKGNSSYRSTNNKNPLHIELNYVKTTQNYKGITDIKLGNGFSDPSMIREALSYEILRNYMYASRCNFARVNMNGTYYGVYSNAEHLGDPMLTHNFHSTHGTLVKCNPTQTSNSTGPDLRYLGTAPTSYSPYYEIKNGIGFTELIGLCDTLNNNFSNIEKALDIDGAIWMLAFNNLLINLDSYSGTFRQNYYLYKSEADRFYPIIWDLNMSFAGFPMVSATSRLDTSTAKTFPLNSNVTSSVHPLITKIYNYGTYRRMLQAHIKTMAQEMFATGSYASRGLSMQNIIDSSVNADPYKFFTYTNFRSNLNSSVAGGGPPGPGGGAVSGITSLMAGRLAFLNTQSWYTNAGPNISVSLSDTNPAFLSTVTVKATIPNITAANYVYLGYRDHQVKAFQKVQMFDDGAHNDGGANDKVFGAYMPISSARIEYYVYAEDLVSDQGAFAPARAEHEFFSVDAIVPQQNPGDLIINEFVASNLSGARDYNGEYNDWLEIKNKTTDPISLDGVFLTDTFGNNQKWSFPKQTVVPAQGYVLVWCDEDVEQGGLHANFKLSASGERLKMTTASATLDSFIFGQQFSNLSSARCIDGSGPFLNGRNPTPLQINACPAASQDVQNSSSIYPNPGNEELIIESTSPIYALQIVNISGQRVKQLAPAGALNVQLNMEDLPTGIYFIQVNQEWKKWIKQ